MVAGDEITIALSGTGVALAHSHLPSPLAAGTPYYAVPLGLNSTSTSGQIGLAATQQNALANPPVLIGLTSGNVGPATLSDVTQNTTSAWLAVLLQGGTTSILPLATSTGELYQNVNIGSGSQPFNSIFANQTYIQNCAFANSFGASSATVAAANGTGVGTWNNAAPLTAAWNFITATTANMGVRLANLAPANGYFTEQRVINTSAYPIIVYPGPVTANGNFLGMAEGVGITLGAGGSLYAYQTTASNGGLNDIVYETTTDSIVSGSGTDASQNAPSALTTLGTFTVTNPGQYYVQNQSANNIQVIMANSGGTNPTIILLAPGGNTANVQGADTSPGLHWFTGQITVAGTSGSQFAARHN